MIYPTGLMTTLLGIDLMFDEMAYREMEGSHEVDYKAEDSRVAELRDTLLGFRSPVAK
jgi:ATP-dependent RNA/DNA helicase IGHMBP2